jgi:hypothetical protein
MGGVQAAVVVTPHSSSDKHSNSKHDNDNGRHCRRLVPPRILVIVFAVSGLAAGPLMMAILPNVYVYVYVYVYGTRMVVNL